LAEAYQDLNQDVDPEKNERQCDRSVATGKAYHDRVCVGQLKWVHGWQSERVRHSKLNV